MTRAEELKTLYEALVGLSHISKDTRQLLESVIKDIADLDETVEEFRKAKTVEREEALGVAYLGRVAERNAE